MNIEVFIEELRGLFLPKGKLNVASTNNIPGQPMPRFDMIQFVEAVPKDINTYIRNLQDQFPLVVVDVKNELSMTYILGTSVANVVNEANKQYTSLPDVVAEIQQNASLINDAYNVSVAYDKASVLFAQYSNTGMKNEQLLKDAYNALCGYTLYGQKCGFLLNAIVVTAKQNGVKLP